MVDQTQETIDDYLAQKVYADLLSETWEPDDALIRDLSRECVLRRITDNLVGNEDIPSLEERARTANSFGLRTFAIHCARTRSSVDEWRTFRALARDLFDDSGTAPWARCYLLFQILHRSDEDNGERYIEWCWRNPGVFLDNGIHYWYGDRSLMLSDVTGGPRITTPAYRMKFPLYACYVAYAGTAAELPWLQAQSEREEPSIADAARRALQILELRLRFDAHG
jgi:hypothetical protein